MGTPLIPCPGILSLVRRWDVIAIDWDAGLVRNETTGKALRFDPLSAADRDMLETGGLVPYLKRAREAAQG